MSHPTPGRLLELHFGELPEHDAAEAAAHASGCRECAALLADLGAVERALGPGLWDAPPADGLDRVLRRVEGLKPVRQRRALGVRAVVPSLIAALSGVAAVHQGGLVAALVLFAAGALVTLALAPVLILESQRRSS
jgi:anti-sigma factor RsiW